MVSLLERPAGLVFYPRILELTYLFFLEQDYEKMAFSLIGMGLGLVVSTTLLASDACTDIIFLSNGYDQGDRLSFKIDYNNDVKSCWHVHQIIPTARGGTIAYRRKA